MADTDTLAQRRLSNEHSSPPIRAAVLNLVDDPCSAGAAMLKFSRHHLLDDLQIPPTLP
jgi:hypothetical protein